MCFYHSNGNDNFAFSPASHFLSRRLSGLCKPTFNDYISECNGGCESLELFGSFALRKPCYIHNAVNSKPEIFFETTEIKGVKP